MKILLDIGMHGYRRPAKRMILETFFEALTRTNVAYLVQNPDTPKLYASGVRYKREGYPERWKDIPRILRDGVEDCEGLAAWLAAEMRLEGNPTARVVLEPQRERLWHAVVADEHGQRWDPSRRLGMRPRSRQQKEAMS